MSKARVRKNSTFLSQSICFVGEKMERQAINFVIQASACDLMKLAMERINQALDRLFPFDLKSKESYFTHGKNVFAFVNLVRPTPIRPVYLVLQIHDELIFEIEKSSRTPEILHLIHHEMEHNNQINLSLPVRIKSGDNWDSMISVV
jgi:DNA polymerase I-like protein with 3'-5' exonuclease and polymerase domains